MTSLSPPTPSDADGSINLAPAAVARLRARAIHGRPIQPENIVALCDALLGEREAHSATRAALQIVRDELDRHGHGDFHYGNMPRDPKVLAALAVADAALSSKESNSE